jgi:hypothetical protein
MSGLFALPRLASVAVADRHEHHGIFGGDASGAGAQPAADFFGRQKNTRV